MRILLLTHAFNSLTQRLFVVLREQGHDVSVEFDVNDATTADAVARYEPELIVAPFLKRAIAEPIWRNHVCLIVHPGIVGDRGPSALDWAILNEEASWGVTVLQANGEMDAGDIWATAEFPMRSACKSSLYRHEVTDAAIQAVTAAIERFESRWYRPTPLAAVQKSTLGQCRPVARQTDRRIDWRRDSTRDVLRKIHSADGVPGVRVELFGRPVHLYDAHREGRLKGKPGTVIARSGAAICVATTDGAIWIGHARAPDSAFPFKLPASRVFAAEIDNLPDIAASENSGYRDLWYEEYGDVGILRFPFYNGAMSTDQCERLRHAFVTATKRDTRVIVLAGGPDFWSNGMHLNLIEAADSAADASWENINAIDDLAAEVLRTTSHITVAALCGNAGAGGVFLARAADEVWAREGIVLNPHYKDMGNLFGSEFWTYLLPRYCGAERAEQISQARLPMGVTEAFRLGLIDRVINVSRLRFDDEVTFRAKALAGSGDFATKLDIKNRQRRDDEVARPLDAYREEELKRMRLNFYGFDPSYHVARYNFVYKIPKSRTPLTLAKHRRTAAEQGVRNVS